MTTHSLPAAQKAACAVLMTPAILVLTAALHAGALPQGNEGIAAHYPGDAGIDAHPKVVFVENFEHGHLEEIQESWGFARHLDAMALTNEVSAASAGQRSLRMTAQPDREGVELYKTFDNGWDKIHLRFQVRFAEDYGFNHHFVSLRGFADPQPWPPGGAGTRPGNHFSVTIEPTALSRNRFPETLRLPPPGAWQFYAYWPEMRSYQTPEGEADPTNDSPAYYGNVFLPEDPGYVVPHGQWQDIEFMLKLNSSPDEVDGELALWVNGELAVHFAPGKPSGRFLRDHWQNHPGIDDAIPFPGFRWRKDEAVKINVLRLQNYVSKRVFDRTATYASEHTDSGLNPEQATVWFDNIVLASEYIGPVSQAADD